MPSKKSKPLRRGYLLPYNMRIDVVGQTGEISSLLSKQIGRKAADVLESFLLALACEGVDLWDPAFSRALMSTVDAIRNHET